MYKQIIKDLNLIKKNYKGEYIPVIGGIIFIIFAILCWYILYSFDFIDYQIYNVNLFIISLIGMTGLLDDICGNKKSQGFKGHFKSLMRGKLTTGIIKVLVTFFVTVIAILKVGANNLTEIFLNTGIIMLMTNLSNLLDLRPGRSIKLFLFLSFCLFFFNFYSVIYFLPYYIPLFFYLPYEIKGRVMLGDSGANMLGAVLGFNVILIIDYFYIRCLILLFLIFLNLISEKYSFSTIIQKNAFLKWIDKLGR